MSYKYFGQTINGSASVLYGTPHFAFGVDIPEPVVQTPYIVFRFEEGMTPPSVVKGSTWERIVTSEYNDWKWSCEAYADQYYVNIGWQFAFSTSDGAGKLKYSSLGEVDIISWGNLDTIETTDRMFYNCDAIVNVPNIFVNGFVDGVLVDCASMFNGCTRMDSTQELDLYNTIKNFTHLPSNHSQMFANTDTTAMASIPVSWGGTYVTPGVILYNTLNGNKWAWHINDLSGLDMSTLSSVEIYTTASVSQYAGVNRRKSNIKWASGTTANRNNPIYYYPCIATISNSGASTPPTAIQHAFITTNYNGILTGSTTAGDMPGTLDPAATGPLAYEIGTYDASTSGTYCFGFLVTQMAPSGMSALTSLNYDDCNFGFLNNSYFSAHAPLYYSPDTLVEK